MRSHRGSVSPSIRKPSIFNLPNLPPSRRSSPHLPRIALLTIRTLIILLVFWCEYGTFWSMTSGCRFDETPGIKGEIFDLTARSGKGGWIKDSRWLGKKPFHLMIVSDPQILDMRSYPGRNWFLRWVGVKITDAYIRKAWRLVRKSRGKSGPVEGIVWLGDLMDSGVDSVDKKEHAEYAHRFFLNFPLPRQTTFSPDKSLIPPIPNIYVPGNHDLGLHLSSPPLAEYVREQFTTTFGPTHGKKELGGWEIVWIDSMALLEEGEVGDRERSWIQDLGKHALLRPRILLSHIPLYRPEGTSCGKERERGTIRQGMGKNYQNELDSPTSEWLAKTLQPSLIYSGDDHDACLVQHDKFHVPGTQTPVVETTVKAFSMAMGIQHPGYHLLTLYPALTESLSPPYQVTYTQTNCTLPSQLSIWLHVYAPLLGLLIASFLFPKLYSIAAEFAGANGGSSRTRRQTTSARSNGLPVHRHRKSLSRTLFNVASGKIGENAEEFEELDQDAESQFPTFPYSPTTIENFSHGFDSSDDGNPDAYGTRSQHRNGSAAAQPKNVRRVSRVWLWEQNGGKSPYADFDTPLTTASRSSSSILTKLDLVLSRLGPGYRYLIKPALRNLKILAKKIWIVPVLASLVEGLRRNPMGEIVVDTLAQVTELVWPGVVLWMAIWFWFSL